MAKTREEKKQIIKDLAEKIKKAKSVVFTNFDSLTVAESMDLRKKLKDEKGEYYVAKKTLLSLALNENGIKGVDVKSFAGKIAAVFGYEDEVAPASVIDKFRKGHEEKINFVGGLLDGKFMDAVTVGSLAKLPSKTELQAKVVGSLNAPLSGLVNTLVGNLRNLVYALKAIEETKK
jgi:large subunit ribosomal protein L10